MFSFYDCLLGRLAYFLFLAICRLFSSPFILALIMLSSSVFCSCFQYVFSSRAIPHNSVSLTFIVTPMLVYRVGYLLPHNFLSNFVILQYSHYHSQPLKSETFAFSSLHGGQRLCRKVSLCSHDHSTSRTSPGNPLKAIAQNIMDSVGRPTGNLKIVLGAKFKRQHRMVQLFIVSPHNSIP